MAVNGREQATPNRIDFFKVISIPRMLNLSSWLCHKLFVARRNHHFRKQRMAAICFRHGPHESDRYDSTCGSGTKHANKTWAFVSMLTAGSAQRKSRER
jgi:hypothetical protein